MNCFLAVVMALRFPQAAALAAVLLCAPALASTIERFSGEVVGVADGDTVTVVHRRDAGIEQRKVRLASIDAPERKQAFGNVSREAMGSMTFGQVADLECRSTDRYKRSVCVVRVGGVDVGLRLIELGLAWHFKRYASAQPAAEAQAYAAAEDAARNSATGLWRDLGTQAEPVAPWDWRASQK